MIKQDVGKQSRIMTRLKLPTFARHLVAMSLPEEFEMLAPSKSRFGGIVQSI
jgi:hypothetical protein